VRGWASGIVPDDLLPSQYDVVIEDPKGWPATYDQIVQAQVKIPFAEEARRAAIRAVLEQPGLLTPTRRWSPSPSILNTEAGTARASFDVGLSLTGLLKSSTDWLLQPGLAMYDYTQEQLGDWLLGGTESGDSPGDRQQRFVSGLGFAFTKAAPLIELDNAALSRVHGDVEIATDFVTLMTPLPMDSSHDAAPKVLQALIRAKVLGDTTTVNDDEFKKFFNPASKNSTIGVLRFLGGPVSPLVVNSIAEPLAAAADSNAGDLGFYQNNRARPLNHSVPAPPNFLRALIRGYFIGRVLGHVDVRTPGRPRVWTPNGWIEYSDFLGPAPTANADVLGGLCESMPLAIVKSVRAKADAVRFHRTIAELGSVHLGGKAAVGQAGTPQSVMDWVTTGTYPAGTDFAYLPDGGGDAASRVAAIRAALDNLQQPYAKISAASPPNYDDPYGRRRWDLAPEIVAALTVLRDGIALPDKDDRPAE
jgi:hypothetical protein